MIIQSIQAHAAGDPSVGIPEAFYTLDLGGEDIDDIERVKKDFAEFIETCITGEPVTVLTNIEYEEMLKAEREYENEVDEAEEQLIRDIRDFELMQIDKARKDRDGFKLQQQLKNERRIFDDFKKKQREES